MTPPSFSIVIPTFERWGIVCETVLALNALEYVGTIEIVVAIDGSTDGTASALAAIESRFPLKLLELDHGGAGHARNQGAAAANNDIILFLDDDMRAQADLVDQHARLYLDGADSVIGDLRHDPATPPGFVADAIELWISAARPPGRIEPFDVFTGQLSVRRDLFEQLGGFDESFTTGGNFANEDVDFGVRLLDGHDVRYNPDAITHQSYVVSLRENFARAPRQAAGDLHFAARHPRLARRLFEQRGGLRPVARLVYRPLACVPFLPRLLVAGAVRIGEFCLGTRHRSNPLLRRIIGAARWISYWAAVRANGGFPQARRLLVLCYHAIKDQSADPVLAPFGVPPPRFLDHLDSLRSRGFVFVGP
ncbi:MAG: glycosyltransferase, partial [Sphingomicrobium sp.]